MQKKRIGIAVSEGFNTSLLIQLLKNSQLAQFYTIDTLIIKKNIAATPKNIVSHYCELTNNAFFSFILKLEKKIIS